MNAATKTIIYAMYARKSSEAEDRQALSIESQIAENGKIAAQHGVVTSDDFMFSESKSAKDPFHRVGFEELIKSIEHGQVQGVIAWHANRLSRNAIDAARLVHLMDQGKLREIVTQQQVFRGTPQDKFMFTLFCSQAKMENDNKGIDVKRGLRKRREQGFLPGMAKVGYLNDFGKKGSCTVLMDPERFPLVKEALELFVTGKYSVRGLLVHVNETMGLRTVQRKKEGGNRIYLSHLYKILKDPFYAGFFYANDEQGNKIRYEVNTAVPRAITEAKYWQIQAMLGRRGVSRPSVNKEVFAYLGLAKCKGCSGSICAEQKLQLICSGCKYKFAYQNKDRCPKCGVMIAKMKNPKYLRYVYYHCVKYTNPRCTEGSMREEDIDTHLADYIQEHLELSPEMSEWCIRNVGELEKKEEAVQKDVQDAWKRELIKKEKEEDELMRMRMRGLVEDDKFLALQGPLKLEIKEIRGKLGRNTIATTRDSSKPFRLACGLSDVFRHGTYQRKKDALAEAVSNLTIRDKKASICFTEELELLVKGLEAARSINSAFEPRFSKADKDETEVFASVRPTLLRG